MKDYEEDFADYDEQEEQEYGHEEVTINSNVLHGDTIRSPLEHATYGGEEGQTTLSADTIAADSEYLNEDDFADEFENHPTPENDLDEQTHYDSGSRGEANPHFAGPNATFDVTDPEFENLVRNNEDADLDEINYDEGEDQESKHSEHTLLGDDTTQDLEVDGIAQTQGDEIDYDEDDAEPVSPPVPKGSLDDTVIWNAQPSKRSRADTEDTTDRRSKGEKWTHRLRNSMSNRSIQKQSDPNRKAILSVCQATIKCPYNDYSRNRIGYSVSAITVALLKPLGAAHVTLFLSVDRNN